MYIVRPYNVSKLKSVEKLEGEPIELKIERIMHNNEPITDGAPSIFTERGDGVLSAYNIRTDRWEVAADGMNVVSKSIQAQRDNKAQKRKETSKEDSKETSETKVVELKSKDVVGGAKSIEGGKAS
jgi:hypothetical protein